MPVGLSSGAHTPSCWLAAAPTPRCGAARAPSVSDATHPNRVMIERGIDRRLRGPVPGTSRRSQMAVATPKQPHGELAVEDTDRAADALVVFGITGDLAKVMTFHSLYRLEA